MPASKDKVFYDMLNSIAHLNGDEDAIQQNKRIKEAEFAEDIREPNETELEAIRKELAKEARSKWDFTFAPTVDEGLTQWDRTDVQRAERTRGFSNN